ncbi:MAG TPA: hypothetical protein VGI48_12885 [Caldimonas sp.]|jgi:hypothetical protein
MNTNARLAALLGVALLLTCAALAQPVPAADAGAPPSPRVHSVAGVEYLNGGAGEEARAAIDAQREAFPLRLVFSVAGGAYVVADHVDVNSAKGKVLGVDNAGPMLLVKVPPGDYTVDASYGGKTEQRKVRIGRDAATVNWRWPEEARR